MKKLLLYWVSNAANKWYSINYYKYEYRLNNMVFNNCIAIIYKLETVLLFKKVNEIDYPGITEGLVRIATNTYWEASLLKAMDIFGSIETFPPKNKKRVGMTWINI